MMIWRGRSEGQKTTGYFVIFHNQGFFRFLLLTKRFKIARFRIENLQKTCRALCKVIPHFQGDGTHRESAVDLQHRMKFQNALGISV